MRSSYRVKATDLTSDLIKALQYVYRDREIEIVVSDVIDETDYLIGPKANRDQLLGAIQDIEKGEHLVTVALESLTSEL